MKFQAPLGRPRPQAVTQRRPLTPVPAPRGTVHAHPVAEREAVGLFRGDELVTLLRPLEVGRLRAELRDAIYALASQDAEWPPVDEYR